MPSPKNRNWLFCASSMCKCLHAHLILSHLEASSSLYIRCASVLFGAWHLVAASIYPCIYYVPIWNDSRDVRDFSLLLFLHSFLLWYFLFFSFKLSTVSFQRLKCTQTHFIRLYKVLRIRNAVLDILSHVDVLHPSYINNIHTDTNTRTHTRTWSCPFRKLVFHFVYLLSGFIVFAQTDWCC